MHHIRFGTVLLARWHKSHGPVWVANTATILRLSPFPYVRWICLSTSPTLGLRRTPQQCQTNSLFVLRERRPPAGADLRAALSPPPADMPVEHVRCAPSALHVHMWVGAGDGLSHGHLLSPGSACHVFGTSPGIGRFLRTRWVYSCIRGAA